MVQHGNMNLLLVCQNESPEFDKEIRSFYKKFPLNLHITKFDLKKINDFAASYSSEVQSWVLFLDDSFEIPYAEHFNILKETFQNGEIKIVIGDRYLNKAGQHTPYFLNWIEKLAFAKLQTSFSPRLEFKDMDFFSPIFAVSCHFFFLELNQAKPLKERSTVSSPWAVQVIKAASKANEKVIFVPIKATKKKQILKLSDILGVLLMPIEKIN